jgi:adenylate cyclase class 2
MIIEYEATFQDIDKEDIQERLKNTGAELIRAEFLQKRVVLLPPAGHEINGGFIRVRDEGDKTTLTLKIIDGTNISDQKETSFEVSDFDAAVSLLNGIGCISKSYEESRRELWNLDGVEIMIDEWPYLGPLVEVEGKSEQEVKAVSEKIGFDWNNAKFCAIGKLYVEKYGLGPIDLANKTGKMTRLAFHSKNPFV